MNLSLGSLACLSLGFLTATALGAPPRFFARPVEGLIWNCYSAPAPIHSTAIANDGRVLGEANCGTTTFGSRAFVTSWGGSAVELAHGTFTFTQPVAFLGGSRVLLMGDWCPPVNGTCTTALALTDGGTELTVLGASIAASSVCNDANEFGWAVGWGGVSASGAWRVRPDATLESLTVPKGWGLNVHAVNGAGTAVGSAYVSNQLRAVVWGSANVATVLPSVESGTSSSASGVGIDGSIVGQSNGRACWWFNGNPISLMSVGNTSEATHMAGSPLTLDPLGYSIFGTMANSTRFFRSNSASGGVDIGPIDASAQFQSLSIVAAPRPDFMVGSAHSALYEPVTLVWALGDTVRNLKTLVVNPPPSTQPFVAVDANSSRQILVNLGFGGAPYILTQLSDGDTNGDQIVDAIDLAETLAGWGAVPANTREAGDFDGNGSVDGGDVAVVLSNWS